MPLKNRKIHMIEKPWKPNPRTMCGANRGLNHKPADTSDNWYDVTCKTCLRLKRLQSLSAMNIPWPD